MDKNLDYLTDDDCCPACGSDRITRLDTYDAFIGINLKTGACIYRSAKPKYPQATFRSYRCRACGWMDAGMTV